MKRRRSKQVCAAFLICMMLAGCTETAAKGDTLAFKDPDEVVKSFEETDANAVVSYENLDFNDIIVQEMQDHFKDAKNARTALEKATQKYEEAVAKKEKEEDIQKKYDKLLEEQEDFAEKAAYELRLKNLLMVSNEGVAKNENSEDLKESKIEASCPYHLKNFHSSDAFNIFETETQEINVEEEEKNNPAPSDMVAAANDTTISEEQKQALITGTEKPSYQGGYVDFKSHIYASHIIEGAGNLLKDSEGNPIKDGEGGLLTSPGKVVANENDYLTITFSSNEIVELDATTGVAVKKTYQGKFTLEDENVLNYIRYMYHNKGLTAKQYENVYNFVDPDAKNLKGNKLDDDAKKASAYLPPPEYIGTFGSLADAGSVLKFYTSNLFSPYADSHFKKSKLKTDQLNVLKSAAKQTVVTTDMGHYQNLMCVKHMTSYHIITNSLAKHVTDEQFRQWLLKYSKTPENVNIVQFRKDFKIDIETFKTLTLNPEHSMAPYNVEMVYADDTISGAYFRFGKNL